MSPVTLALLAAGGHHLAASDDTDPGFYILRPIVPPLCAAMAAVAAWLAAYMVSRPKLPAARQVLARWANGLPWGSTAGLAAFVAMAGGLGALQIVAMGAALAMACATVVTVVAMYGLHTPSRPWPSAAPWIASGALLPAALLLAAPQAVGRAAESLLPSGRGMEVALCLAVSGAWFAFVCGWSVAASSDGPGTTECGPACARPARMPGGRAWIAWEWLRTWGAGILASSATWIVAAEAERMSRHLHIPSGWQARLLAGVIVSALVLAPPWAATLACRRVAGLRPGRTRWAFLKRYWRSLVCGCAMLVWQILGHGLLENRGERSLVPAGALGWVLVGAMAGAAACGCATLVRRRRVPAALEIALALAGVGLGALAARAGIDPFAWIAPGHEPAFTADLVAGSVLACSLITAVDAQVDSHGDLRGT